MARTGKTQQAVFQKTVFANGMTVLTERQVGFRSLSMGVWVRAGTRHEPMSDFGVSHFLEHMLFKGTRHRTALEIAREVDRVGGEFNAFTAREHTCFHILLLEKDCDLGLEILTDVLLNSLFLPDEIERERKVVLQEIAMVDEAPEELVHDLFFEKVYQNHGLGRSILGSKQSITKLKREQIVRYFFRHYRPEQLVFSVAGDVDHQQILKKLKPLARAQWPGRERHNSDSDLNASVEAALKSPVPQSGIWTEHRKTEQLHLVWGVPGPMYSSSDRFSAFLLNAWLGGGMSSALFQEIREKKGLAYTIYSSLSPHTDAGLFTIYLATSKDQVKLCLKLIEQCVDRIVKQPMKKSELDWIKDNVKGTILLSADSVESRMASIAQNEIFLKKYVTVDQVCAQIDSVQPKDLLRVAQTLFKSARSVLMLGPQ